jgi:hypothetical protein
MGTKNYPEITAITLIVPCRKCVGWPCSGYETKERAHQKITASPAFAKLEDQPIFITWKYLH